ncbi:MAG: integration host factor subunit beta [Deltaproteobacteria bacterium]|nr:integration host factor subunit beta [Deltaproteobacteria bacterium]
MTKSELIALLSRRFPTLSVADTRFTVDLLLGVMTHALATGNRIEIRGFGTFSVTHRPAREGRNPKSGEKVLVPEKRVAHFKAGKELRKRVDSPDRKQKIKLLLAEMPEGLPRAPGWDNLDPVGRKIVRAIVEPNRGAPAKKKQTRSYKSTRARHKT